MMQTICHFASSDENVRFGQFLDWLSARGRSSATARSYRSDWQDLAAYFRRSRGQPFTAEALDAETVSAWRESGRTKGKSPATLTRRLAFARTYGRWLAYDGVVSSEVAAEVREVDNESTGQRHEPREDRSPRLLMDAEVNQLLRQVEQRGCRRDQAILYVLLDTGLKVSELVALDVGDVDFATGTLRIAGPRVRRVEVPTPAARKVAWSLAERGLLSIPESGEITLPASGGWPPCTRVPQVDPGTLPQIMAVPTSPMPFGVEGPPAEWPLFVGERGRLTSNAVQRVLRKHTAFARVDASPHVLRYTFAFAYWQRTRDLVSLAEQLGLESLESAKAYTQILPLSALPVAGGTLPVAGGTLPVDGDAPSDDRTRRPAAVG